jgi:hypothetical protein
MKVKFHLTIGFAGADHEDEVELPDEFTDEQIEEELRDWAHNYIEYSFEKIQ